MESLFAMDFFTVDTLFNRRYYVFFIIYLKTRQIIQFGITQHPTRQFVRNQLTGFMYNRIDSGKTYIIHDRASAFTRQDYRGLGITNIITSVKAPNMNSFAERFVRSIRQELLNWFIIFSRNQLDTLIRNYIKYFNSQRPHQGIGQQSPLGYIPQTDGKIVKIPILGGLCHHYCRELAA